MKVSPAFKNWMVAQSEEAQARQEAIDRLMAKHEITFDQLAVKIGDLWLIEGLSFWRSYYEVDQELSNKPTTRGINETT